MSGYFPVTLKLGGRRCLVVGGGKVALRKARALMQAGAKVIVAAPEFDPAFNGLQKKGAVLRRKRYSALDLRGAFFAVAATNDRELNDRISRDARKARILINVVDEPDLSDAIIPSTLRRGDFSISVSTGGASPMLAAKIRREAEKEFHGSFGGYVALLGELRDKIRLADMTETKKRKLLRAILDERGKAVYCEEGRAAAREYLQKKIGGK